MADDLKANIEFCRERLAAACARAGRRDEVSIIGVTKTHGAELIAEIAAEGLLTDVGENRVQELTDKYPTAPQLRWHMIGRLQTNKVKYLIGKVFLIHSVDSLDLAKEIDKRSARAERRTPCLIEVNMGEEPSKGGIAPEEFTRFAETLAGFGSIEVRGVMTVMPNTADTERLKRLYADFYRLSERLRDLRLFAAPDVVSCGMSNDYELAAEYGGATTVRLGRCLFGARN